MQRMMPFWIGEGLLTTVNKKNQFIEPCPLPDIRVFNYFRVFRVACPILTDAPEYDSKLVVILVFLSEI